MVRYSPEGASVALFLFTWNQSLPAPTKRLLAARDVINAETIKEQPVDFITNLFNPSFRK